MCRDVVRIGGTERTGIQQHVGPTDLHPVDGIHKVLLGIGLGDIGPRDRLLESAKILFQCTRPVKNAIDLIRGLGNIRLELVGLEREGGDGIGMPINGGRLFSHSAFDLVCRLGELRFTRILGLGITLLQI